MREFESGATRDADMDKMDYEAFFSPIVLRERARFMHRNRFQKNGVVRDGDNWQKGMPQSVYMKSLFRHVMDVWTLHRKQLIDHETDLIESLCAVMFNAEGMLYEILKEEQAGQALFLMAEFYRGGDNAQRLVAAGGSDSSS